MQMFAWSNNRSLVYGGVALFSGLLTLYRSTTRDLINGDGILNVDIAKAFLNDGLLAAIDVYHWAFYGVLIGIFHKLTGLGFEASASLLNALLMMLVALAFVRIYEEISGAGGRLWIAALLVLALPVLNEYREFVIRGFGFLAFMLLALLFFIQYSRSQGIRDALLWQLAMAAATLFRIEGVAFLALAPSYFLFVAGQRRRIVAHYFRLNIVFIVLTVAGVAALLLSGKAGSLVQIELPYQLDYSSPLALIGAINREAEALFARNIYMADVEEARLILAAGLMMLVLIKVASNLGLPVLAVWGYGVYRKWVRLSPESHIVLYFALISWMTLVAVAGNYFFLSSRYTLLLVLLLFLIAVQYIDRFFYHLAQGGRRKLYSTAWLLVLVLFLDSVISGGVSKSVIRDAGEWVEAELDANARVACNEARLEFYSGDLCRWVLFHQEPPTVTVPKLNQQGFWVVLDQDAPADTLSVLKNNGFEYLLLWLHRKDDVLRQAVDEDKNLVLEKEFVGEKGSVVRLYSIAPESAGSRVPSQASG